MISKEASGGWLHKNLHKFIRDSQCLASDESGGFKCDLEGFLWEETL